MSAVEKSRTREPAHIKLYLDRLDRFDTGQLSINPILAELLKRASYAGEDATAGGMIILLGGSEERIIAKRCGVSFGRVKTAVSGFVKKGYIRRLHNSVYQLNPSLFGRGSWKNIKNIRESFDDAV